MLSVQTSFPFSWKDILKMLAIVMSATVAITVLNIFMEDRQNVSVVYILSVVVVCCTTQGYLYGMIASVLGVIGLNFFFTYPYFALNFIHTGYPVTFAIMLGASLITSTLTTRIKQQAIAARKREKRTEAVYEIAQQLLLTDDVNKIVALIAQYLMNLFSCSVAVYEGKPNVVTPYLALYHEKDRESVTIREEVFAAIWSYSNRKETGAGTDSCPEAKFYYLPILYKEQSLGVIGLYGANDLLKEQENQVFLQMIVSQAAIAITRQNLTEEQHQSNISAEKEKMRSNLLRAISHDLRTPLTAIIGASSVILDNGSEINETEQNKLICDIKEDAQWLIRMVENLLSVTRISGGNTNLKKEPQAAEEIVAEAAARVRAKFKDCKINVKVPADLLMVPMDATLIEQVIINLLENALKYAGDSLPVELTVKVKDEFAVFEVEDYGKGIDEEQLPFLFEGYFEKQNTSSDTNRGMGIGLSICRSIVNAHNGDIQARNKSGGGALFWFTLPLEQVLINVNLGQRQITQA